MRTITLLMSTALALGGCKTTREEETRQWVASTVVVRPTDPVPPECGDDPAAEPVMKRGAKTDEQSAREYRKVLEWGRTLYAERKRCRIWAKEQRTSG